MRGGLPSDFLPILKTNTSLFGSDISVYWVPSGAVQEGGVTITLLPPAAPHPPIFNENGWLAGSQGARMLYDCGCGLHPQFAGTFVEFKLLFSLPINRISDADPHPKYRLTNKLP